MTVQRDFGDGSAGSPQFFSSGSSVSHYSYVEIHAYNPGHTYTTLVNILSLPSCPPSVKTVTIPSAATCATDRFLAAFCVVFRFLFLLSASIVAPLYIASVSSLCANPSILSTTATGSLIVAASSLLFILLACRKCMCSLPLKLLGQLLLITGVIFAEFILQPVCVQFAATPPVSLARAILFAVAFLFFGFLELYLLWYLEGCCPVTICEFWQAVSETMIVAFLAATIVYAALQPLGMLPAGWGVALALAYAIMTYANLRIAVNQNNC